MKRSNLALTFALALVMFGASAQISQQALVDSMIANHGRIKSALLNEEILRIQSKQTWNLPTTDFNLQQGQINASNWDYFFTISQSFEGIWQKNSLKKWVQTQGKRTNIENQILIKELTLELREFIWLYVQSERFKEIISNQKEMMTNWKVQLQQQTKSGYSANWELWVVNQQLQKIIQEENRFSQQLVSLKKSIELYAQVEIQSGIEKWNLLDEPIKKELATIFNQPKGNIETSFQNQLDYLQHQKIPSPYVGAFQQQLESVPGYFGFVAGLKVPLNYAHLQREKTKANLEYQQEMENYSQEIKSKNAELQINLNQIELEKKNYFKALEMMNTDQKDLLNWIKNNQSVGNKSFLEQSQLYQTFWENEKMIQETKTRMGLLILQNQFLTQ